jgi:hypothetical protein
MWEGPLRPDSALPEEKSGHKGPSHIQKDQSMWL